MLQQGEKEGARERPEGGGTGAKETGRKWGTEGRTERRGYLERFIMQRRTERNGREPFQSLTHFVPGAAHVSCLYFSARNVDIRAKGVYVGL